MVLPANTKDFGLGNGGAAFVGTLTSLPLGGEVSFLKENAGKRTLARTVLPADTKDFGLGNGGASFIGEPASLPFGGEVFVWDCFVSV